MISRDRAWSVLTEFTKSDSLRKHARAVEASMRAYAGRYDAKVGYRDARQCLVRDIELKADAVFSISDKDLKDCNK